MIKKTLALVALIATITSTLSATVYVVPQEYDNTYTSIKSKAVAIISNTSGISSTSKVLAGQNVRYRCMQIDKVPCRGGKTPSVTVAVTDIVLLDPNDQLLSIYGYEVFTETAGTRWNICSAAVGGYSWDTSTMTSSIDTGGNTIIDYQYIPNTNNENFLFFTDASNRGSNRSHMVIDVQQKCK